MIALLPTHTTSGEWEDASIFHASHTSPLIEISITSCGGIIVMYYSYQTTLKHLIESCVNTQTGAGLD